MMDPQIKQLLAEEIQRQEHTLDLIPSENFASLEVRHLVGSPLMNKYSEGYPGKRYYPGNVVHDAIENRARTQALKAFKLSPHEWGVNVQAYSGSPANLAIYAALMAPGETLMGLGLASGGHLTHGHKVNFSGRFYRAVQYHVDPATGLLNYDAIEKLAQQEKPKVIVSGLTSYPRTLDFKRFGEIAKAVGAFHVADVSHIAGLILAGAHPSPFPYADAVMMTTHKTLAGARGAVIFGRKSEISNTKSQINSNTQSQNKTITIAEAIDRAIFPGGQGGPHDNTTAAHAQLFYETMRPAFTTYAKQIVTNAKALAAALTKKGAVLTTGGTDNHLFVIDVRSWNLDGMTAEKLLEQNSIIANRNSIPGDPSPFKPSGVRMGAPSLTRRSMKEKEMVVVASLIYAALVEKRSVKKEVLALCKKFSAKNYLRG